MSPSGRFFRVLGAILFLLGGGVATAQPHIISYNPFQGAPGTVVTIVGTGLIGPGFVPGTGERVLVFFSGGSGNGAAAQVLAGSANQLRVVVPLGARSGPFSVITSQGQTTSSPFNFFLPPIVTEFGTEFGPLGGFVTPVVGRSGMTLHLRGESFFPLPTGTIVVRVGGRLFTRSVVSDSQIDVFLGDPPANGPVETGPVYVASVVGTNVTSDFVYGQPIIGSFTPRAAPGDLIELTGFNFLGRTNSEVSVRFGGVPASQVNLLSNTNLTVVVPAAALNGPLTFTAPGGAYITPSNFTVLPVITSFTPNKGPAGTVVTISGNGLTGTSRVTFGGTAATAITNLSQLQVTAVTPNNVPTGPITLVTPNGTNVSTALFFGVPRVDNFTPSAGGPGTIITVSGKNFTGATQIQLNAADVPDYLVLDNEQFTFAVPAGATSGRIKVIAPGGTNESTGSFTVRGPEPVITSFLPTSGGPETQVVIRGMNLTTATNVTFNGVKAVFTLVQQTNLQATVPATATTGHIRVDSPNGAAETSANFIVGTSADVRIIFAGNPNPAVAFVPLVYNIQAFNNGPLTAQNTVIEFTIPPGLALIEATGSAPPEINGQQVTYIRGSMEPGGVFTAGLRVNAGEPGTAVAFGRILTSTPDTNPGNNERYSTNVVGPPTLVAETVNPLEVVLSWPSAAGSLYQPKQALRLNVPFLPVPGEAVDDGVRLQMVIPATNQLRFFRLDYLGQ